MKKTIKGTIVSTKMNKTVVVRVEMPKTHPIYGKLVKNSKKYLARNDIGAVDGDIVIIEESRPLSKRVTWLVKEKE